MSRRRADPGRLPAVAVLTVFGYDWCEDTSASRERLHALGVPFRYVNMDEDAVAKAAVNGAGYFSTPTIVTPAGAVVVEPSEAELDALIATLA